MLISGTLAAMLGYVAYTVAARQQFGGALALGLVALIPVAWAAVLFVESVRGARSRLRPFVMLTPSSIARADFDHGVLQAARLGDATDFETVLQYDGKQKFKSRRYVFKFPSGTVEFEVADAEGIARVDEVIARARAHESHPEGDAVVPKTPGLIRPPASRAFTDPFGKFWLVVAALVGVAALAGVIIARS